MTILNYNQRPFVKFDANNKKHREYFADFIKSGTWSTCPVRFFVPDGIGMDQTSMIRSLMIAYYVEKEFKIIDAEAKKFLEAA